MSATVRLVPYGSGAVLAEYDSIESVLAAAAAARRVPGVDDVVPAARTVLVRFEPGGGEPEGLRRALQATVQPPAGQESVVTLPVVYDGPDLGDVAAASGLSVEEVIVAHSTPSYRAAFCGFAPGFAYLTGVDLRLQLPRRATPRTRVPAGAVAVAAEYSAVYPTASPGGWHLLGQCLVKVFDVERDPPALIVPGDIVRFEPR